MYHQLEKSEVIVFGCGNILFGDDGFGPELIKYINENIKIKEKNVTFIDAGTSVNDILFNLYLSDLDNLKKIILIDIADIGKEPGEFIKKDIVEIKKLKFKFFSMHQTPGYGILKKIKEKKKDIKIKIFLLQPSKIPEEVSIGISEILKEKIPIITKEILSEIMY